MPIFTHPYVGFLSEAPVSTQYEVARPPLLAIGSWAKGCTPGPAKYSPAVIPATNLSAANLSICTATRCCYCDLRLLCYVLAYLYFTAIHTIVSSPFISYVGSDFVPATSPYIFFCIFLDTLLYNPSKITIMARDLVADYSQQLNNTD